MPIASARARGPDFELIFFFSLSTFHMEIRAKLLKSRFPENWRGKPEKIVFLAFFDILVNMATEVRFHPINAKNQIFAIFKLKVCRKKSIAR